MPTAESDTDLIGRPIVHVNALKQATGEAKYVDDIPQQVDELYLALVLSTQAHARILEIDPSEALTIPGVKAFFDAKDVPDSQRTFGHKNYDEEIFVSKEVIELS